MKNSSLIDRKWIDNKITEYMTEKVVFSPEIDRKCFLSLSLMIIIPIIAFIVIAHKIKRTMR